MYHTRTKDSKMGVLIVSSQDRSLIDKINKIDSRLKKLSELCAEEGWEYEDVDYQKLLEARKSLLIRQCNYQDTKRVYYQSGINWCWYAEIEDVEGGVFIHRHWRVHYERDGHPGPTEGEFHIIEQGQDDNGNQVVPDGSKRIIDRIVLTDNGGSERRVVNVVNKVSLFELCNKKED